MYVNIFSFNVARIGSGNGSGGGGGGGCIVDDNLSSSLLVCWFAHLDEIVNAGEVTFLMIA